MAKNQVVKKIIKITNKNVFSFMGAVLIGAIVLLHLLAPVLVFFGLEPVNVTPLLLLVVVAAVVASVYRVLDSQFTAGDVIKIIIVASFLVVLLKYIAPSIAPSVFQQALAALSFP